MEVPVPIVPLGLAGLAALLLAAGCPSPQGEPVRVGFLGGMSGRVADLGIAGRDGAQLAVERRNAAGGLGGRRVELVAWNDRQDPAQARAGIRALAGQGVAAVVGPMTSAMAEAAAPVADEERVVLLSPTVSSNELSGRDDFFFRVYPPSRQAAALLAEHVAGPLGATRVAVVSDQGNRAHTESWLQHFRSAFEARGGRIAGVERYTSGAGQQFRPLAEAARSLEPDCVFILANALETAMLCQHLRLGGFAGPIVASEWSAGSDLVQLGGGAVEGLRFFNTFDQAHEGERYRGFAAAFAERFGRPPGFASAHAYDAAQILMDALPAEPEALRARLAAAGGFEGLQGPIRFDGQGDPVRGHRLMTVRDGRFVGLEAP